VQYYVYGVAKEAQQGYVIKVNTVYYPMNLVKPSYCNSEYAAIKCVNEMK
jgi:hypothetical protein